MRPPPLRRVVAMLIAATLSPAQTANPIPPELRQAQEELRKAQTDTDREAVTRRLESIRNKARENGDVATAAMAVYTMGRAYTTLGDYGKAVSAYEEALAYRRTTGDRFGEAVALHNIAAAQWSAGDAQEALETYRKVLPIRREIKDDTGIAYTQFGIASCYWSMGEPAKSLDAYREALGVWTSLKNEQGMADTLSSMGLIYTQLGDARRGVAELDRALAIYRKLGNKAGESYALNNLALAAIAQRRYRDALDLCNRALPALESAGDKRGQAYVLHNHGSAEEGAGRRDSAMESFQRSLAIKRAIEDRWGEAYGLQAMGEIHAKAGERAKARSAYREALAIRRDVRDRAGLITTLAAVARLDRDESNLGAARDSTAEAIALMEESRLNLASEDLRASYFASNRDYYDFYVDTLARLGEHRAALEAAERARGRLLLDRLSDTLAGVRKGADPALLAQETKLQARVNAAADRLRRYFSGPRSPAHEAAIREQLSTLLNQRRDLRERIRRSSPRYAALAEPPLLSAGEIQALLDPQTLLLNIFSGRERLHLWVVAAHSIRYHALPAGIAPESLLKVAAPEIEKRKPRRLVIGADGPAESIPFATLSLPGDPQPLVARFEIVNLPSASALALSRSLPTPTPPKTLLALADPVYGPPDSRLPSNASDAPEPLLPRLRFSGEEVEAAARLVPELQRTIATGFDASRAALARLPLRNYRVLHFAAHTELNGENAELSGVILSRYDATGALTGGFLRLHEIYNLDLRARLVVLSACRSAVGPEQRGEGLLGITRGFLYAGARSVLATLWDVGDKPASELMRRFYRELFEHKLTPAAALRAAQNQMRLDPAWSNPRDWGAFTLQGEWR